MNVRRFTDQPEQPRGTLLEKVEVDCLEPAIRYVYRVKWWCYPWYMIKACCEMISKGLIIVHVARGNTERRESERLH